jgi:hypothetical protein
LRAHAKAAGSGATSELGCQLGILLCDLNLCSGRLSIGQGVDNLALGSGKLGRTLKVLEGSGDVVLLEKELGHGGNSDITLRVD